MGRVPEGNKVKKSLGVLLAGLLLTFALSFTQLADATSSWSTSYDSPEANIYSLAVYGDNLYAGSASNGIIYAYDGSTWSTSYDSSEGYIYSLVVYANKLYAGSASNGIIYVYDGSTWSTSYDSPEEEITSLAVYGSKLYAGTGPNGLILAFEDVAFDFSLIASPDNLTLARSDSTTSTITMNIISGTAQTVSLSGAWVGTAPTGVSASFSPSSGTPTFSSTLTLTTTSTASAGNFTYRVTGSGGGLTRTDQIIVRIAAPPTVPSLSSPGNGTTIDTLTPTFDWSDVAGAESYTLEIATDNNFSTIVRTKSATESTTTLSETEKLSYGTHYYWRVRGTSDLGTGDWSSTWSITAKLAVPKVTSFEVAAGATYTNSTGIQLTITAQNAVEMSFSSDGVVWDEWETFQASKSYALSTGDGPKNVYIRVKDNVGDISQTSVDSITLDQTSPSTTHSLSGNLGADGYKSSVVVTLTSTDATSGVESTKYLITGGEWRTGDTFVISEDGEHTVEYYSTDAAGKTEETKTFEVKVYTPTAIPPILSQYWWAILSIIVVAGVVSTFVTRRVRLASRLKRITREKAELSKLKLEAETKYFREGSISRETYDTLVKDHERRKAELEKDERVLQARVKRKVKAPKKKVLKAKVKRKVKAPKKKALKAKKRKGKKSKS
ncbi:MAG: hypothetical protein CEE41_03665 [Hadesarchaea archaeon B3_Hades]|nr:MAG: hypothetical protein CEE41_03665 [Hadesarchaea archaeon B3_Hades]